MIIQYTKDVLLIFIIIIEVGHRPRHDLDFNVGFKCEVMKPTGFRLLGSYTDSLGENIYFL